MNETADEISEERTGPTYVRVYFLSAVLIALGLSTISVRVAVALGVILIPAHAIAIGLISRIQPWRPVFLKVWPVTAFVIALLFLLPARIIYQMATTPTATFKQLVLNPVPEGVKNIEKEEAPDAQSWISLTFDVEEKTVVEVLATQSFEPASSETVAPELEKRLGQIRLSGAKIYQVKFPDSTVRMTAVVNSRSDRMCVLYERDVK
jgi:hypothetical protein